jgi:hypothetical protein
MQRLPRTGSYASRLFALDEPVDAQITFLHDTILAELGHAKGTRLGAGPTTDTFVSIDDHDAILRSLGDGFGGARIHAARAATMHTRERDGSVDQIRILTNPHADDPAPLDAQFNLVVRLARDLTGVTLDTAIQVDVKPKLLAHSL